MSEAAVRSGKPAAPAARARTAKSKGASSASKSEALTWIEVRQLRSAIGSKPKHRATLRALGLKGIGDVRRLPESPSTMGMVAVVSHLLEVKPCDGPDDRRVARDSRRSQGA
jgi:large subunit ribosomal protein L30